jgi:hypothetical protein
MPGILRSRPAISLSAALLGAALMAMPVVAGGPEVVLQSGTNGCNGVLPSSGGNTNMRVIGGSMVPGGTAVFEISYPVTASSVGKEFTILDCAFINDVATLKYVVSFVPSNQSFVLRMTLGVPKNAPVGGLYCNYVKTTGSPTAPQASQRKAGPACFVIRAPATSAAPPAAPGDPPETPSGPADPSVPSDPSGPILLPNTAMAAPSDAP